MTQEQVAANSQKPIEPGEAEHFWTDGHDALAPAAGEKPETLTIFEAPPSDAQSRAALDAGGGTDLRPAGAGEAAPRRKAYRGEPCCLGVDMPGVGWVHSESCNASGSGKAVPSLKAVRDFLDGVGPDDLVTVITPEDMAEMRAEDAQRMHQEKLFGQLLFAARALANSRLVESPRRNDVGLIRVLCIECSRLVDATPHDSSCLTGQVLHIIAQLMVVFDSNPKEKGAASPVVEGGAQ